MCFNVFPEEPPNPFLFFYLMGKKKFLIDILKYFCVNCLARIQLLTKGGDTDDGAKSCEGNGNYCRFFERV